MLLNMGNVSLLVAEPALGAEMLEERVQTLVCTENPIRVDNATESPKLAG